MALGLSLTLVTATDGSQSQLGSTREMVYRIGTNQSVPMNYWGPQGPEGFAVDVVNEAAARARIRLQWVQVSGDPVRAITSGEVQLWPLVADLAERRRWVYLTRPWWQSDRVLVFAKGASVQGFHSLKPRSVGYVGAYSPDHIGFLERTAAQATPVASTPEAL